jgi:hypothetical protein
MRAVINDVRHELYSMLNYFQTSKKKKKNK